MKYKTKAKQDKPIPRQYKTKRNNTIQHNAKPRQYK